MQVLAYCSRSGPIDAWRSVDATIVRELFSGRLEFDPAVSPEASVSKALGSPLSLTHFNADMPLTYRRSWHDIRANKVGVKVIWVIRRGSLHILRSGGGCVVDAGDAGILDSNAPFQMKMLVDKYGVHESLQIIVPPDLFATHLPGAERLNESFALNSTAGNLTQSLLSLLVEKGEVLNLKTATSLTEVLLAAIGENIGIRPDTCRRPGLVDRRLADIEEFIAMNLADPNLSYAKVAASCGISTRYLRHILKANGKSYSELLWRSRLPKARDLLISSATRNYSIREVAFMSGFKSAAHFSRRFKATYGRPPRKYRDAHGNHP
ncbi:MAG TPA: AraC family transcriptional regulator [Steroidobacteraceae bacterium]|nr:AraC family transcriptional regulator [Steroidobacteraceae bacterium]